MSRFNEKNWSIQKAIQERVDTEDLIEWAITPENRSLAPDLRPYSEKPPLVAIYAFARGCMP